MPIAAALLALLTVFATTQPSAADTESEVHCVAFIVGQAAGGELALSEPDCFDSELEAGIWALTDPADRLDSGFYFAGSTFTLGRHFDGFNGTGSSISIVGSSCTGGYWNTSSSWDNRISSSYNGCARLTHWDEPAKNGSFQHTYGAGTTDNLSYMNNKAESVSYHSG